MDEKISKALDKVQKEMEKIDKNKNNVYFFIFDSKGTPNSELEYIYNLAYLAKNKGHKVSMLYQLEKKDTFVGVKDWLGEEYSNIPHYDIGKGETELSVSDILFIPEVYAGVMNQTKKIPCKRIAIMHNYDYLLAQTPFSAQWGDFGIMEAVCNSEVSASQLKSVFPYERVTVINPFINKIFGTTKVPKKLIINLIVENQDDINKIVKAFYWKYPSLKWVSFRDMKNFSQAEYANTLREGAITIWANDNTSYGYGALEAMKSGNIVMAKLPNNRLPWMFDNDGEKIEENGKTDYSLRNNCIWFDNFNDLHDKIASVIRAWITDKIPTSILKDAEKTCTEYTEEKSSEEFDKYLRSVNDKRKEEMKELIENVTEKENKEEKTKNDDK